MAWTKETSVADAWTQEQDLDSQSGFVGGAIAKFATVGIAIVGYAPAGVKWDRETGATNTWNEEAPL